MTTAGKVDFPDYLKTVHNDWLDNTGTDTIEASVTDAMNAALGASPYSAMTAYDPASQLTAMDSAVAAFNTLVDALDFETDWENAIDAAVAKIDGSVINDAYITQEIQDFAAILDDQIDNVVLPKFQRGLQDVNSVMSSAFVVGEAIIMGMRDRDVAKHGSEVRAKLNLQRNDFVLKGSESMLRDMVGRIELEKSVMHYTIEANRLRAVSLKEKKDTENNISVSNGLWDLQVFQYGANLLAAIGGGVVAPSGNASSGPSKTVSAIAGALSGASIGSSISGGNPIMTLIGAAFGGLSSLF